MKNTQVERVCAENCEQQKENANNSKKESQHNDHDLEAKPNSNKPLEEDKMESTTTNNSTDQDKVLKKPDKILPCPRCNSLETKFCYFNNYNVNQPRHFCKNCQRYWTAGGTMRNVPVGAGRRKNKHHHLASQFRHIIVSSDETSTDSSSLSSPSSMAVDNGIVLKFGPDAGPPLCESMEAMLNLTEQKASFEAESGKETTSLCGYSVTNKESCVSNNEVNTSNHLPFYPIPPFVFPWNPDWNNAVHHQFSAPMQWYHHPTPLLAVPGMFAPPSFWGGTPVWPAGAGTVPIGSNGYLSPSSSTSNSCSSSNGSPLGKHSRDTVFADEEKSEKCVLVPKTLRIDDPSEASKSPLWAALGIKKTDKKDCESEEGCVSKKLETESKDRRMLGVSQILEANPAAISRAEAFQERI